MIGWNVCSGTLVFLTFTITVLSPETGIFHSVFRAQQLADPGRHQQLETAIKLCSTHAGLHRAPLNFQLLNCFSSDEKLIWKIAPQFYSTKFTPSVYSLSSCVFRVLWSRLTSVSEHTQWPLLKINCSVVLSLENVSHNFNLFLHFSGICAIIIEQFTLQLA